MIELKITGETAADIAAQTTEMAALFGGAKSAEPADAGEPKAARRGRPPKSDAAPEAGVAPAASAAPKTSTTTSSAELARAVAGVATVVAPEPNAPDAIEDDDLDAPPSYTRDDCKRLLLEVKNKFKDTPEDKASVTSILMAVAGVSRFGDLPDDKIAATVAAAMKKLA